VMGDGIMAGVGSSWTSAPVSPHFWRMPVGESWAPADSMPVPLGEVAAGVIGNRLYVVGEGSRSTLALDLGTGRWEEASRRAIRPAWGNHEAAEVWNGKLYLFGGLRMGAGVTQIYDPVTDVWTRGPDVPFAAGSSASALIDNRIYIAGGIIGDTTTRLAARFDPAAQTWTPIAPMPQARNHAASATDGRRLFVFGGRGPGSGAANVVANGFADVQIYDPATDTWTASGTGPSAPAPMPQARGGTGKAVYANGEFWVFGGETLDGPGAGPNHTYNRVDVYDPVANRWRAGPPMPTARHGVFPILDENRILLLGGGTHSGQSQSASAEILWLTPPK
jgi:N-acetylneuraminic acid mutarotase